MAAEIHKFYAVTKTSVYLVSDEKDENGHPIVEKIALNGESSIPVDDRLDCTYVVGIMSCLQGYIPGVKSERRPDMRNTRYWTGNSSPITALFTRKDLAFKCLKQPDRHTYDERWEDESRRILSLIGEDHPTFVLGTELLRRVKSGEPLRHY